VSLLDKCKREAHIDRLLMPAAGEWRWVRVGGLFPNINAAYFCAAFSLLEPMELVFWMSLGALAYTYGIFPALMIWRARRHSPRHFNTTDELPTIAIIFAAYNEEAVIEHKLANLCTLDYPRTFMQVWIGSDASSDRTDSICQSYADTYPWIHFYRFSQRQGKAATINRLVSKTNAAILVLTDADVLFAPDLLRRIVVPFTDPAIGLVAARMECPQSNGSSFHEVERTYFDVERHLKRAESTLYGSIMGADGSCYAIRREAFTPFPEEQLVTDDLFETLMVIERGYVTYFADDAVCTPGFPENRWQEYRRKVRVAASNIATLRYLRRFCTRIWTAPALLFWSHKLLRWFGPFLLLAALCTAIVLSSTHVLYRIGAVVLGATMVLPLIPRVHRIPLVRYVAHFVASNYAVLVGIVLFVLGRYSSPVWRPTERTAPVRSSDR
jgi:cellulose synthase/poly-beta-1,6-N-acetylglucosamine synthase-like glycosyltransferase